VAGAVNGGRRAAGAFAALGLLAGCADVGIVAGPRPAEAESYVAAANAELAAKQDRFREEWSLATFARYDVDIDSAWLRFSSPGRAPACFAIRLAGSARAEDHSWEWAWANARLRREAVVPEATLRALGARLGLAELQAPVVTMPDRPGAEDEISWQFTGIAVKALEATGGYRFPVGDLMVFAVVLDPRDDCPPPR
jgi:hypothetical protein